MYNRELHTPTNASLYSYFDIFNVPTEKYFSCKMTGYYNLQNTTFPSEL